MNEDEWKLFLQQICILQLQCAKLVASATLPEVVRASNWLGRVPATEAQILAAEERLKVTLPKDLKAFYRATNGWLLFGTYNFGIVPIEELNWLSESDPSLWSICEVDEEPPSDDAEREFWYEQGIRVRRSLMLSVVGTEYAMLYDPLSAIDSEMVYGMWVSWNPAMEWTDYSFSNMFERERKYLLELRANG
jgi:hypothetical protein